MTDICKVNLKGLRAVLVSMLLLTSGAAMAQVRVKGNVYGGGNEAGVGKTEATTFAKINIETGTIDGGVYGGCNTQGTIEGYTEVKISGGIIGAGSISDAGAVSYTSQANVHGGGYGENTNVTGNVTVNIGTEGQTTDGATIWGDVYGGSALGKVNGTITTDNSTTTVVTLHKGTVRGDVYGGGLGSNTSGNEVEADVYGAVTVTINNGTAQNVFGCNNKNGAPKQTVTVKVEGGTINNNVYGGGNLAAYNGTPEVTMTGGVVADVYGGGYGPSASVAGTSVKMKNGTAEGDKGGTADYIFGGGEEAPVTGAVIVSIEGGTVNHDVYGGGALANTNIGNVTSGYGTASETIPSTSTYTTAVSLKGGKIKENVYGGGLGHDDADDTKDVAALVYGNVTVKLNETTTTENCIVEGSIFGCNNIKGTPKGTVEVHVYKTQNADATKNTKDETTEIGNRTNYDVLSVFGGGNQADYEPVDLTNGKTNVVIEGCLLTSIKNVYGGGNAAAVPASSVDIKSAYIIDYVFGGGNGEDENYPGANVGYKTVAVRDTKPSEKYGTGNAVVKLEGGFINSIFGGSNTLGYVAGSTSTDIESNTDCPLKIGNLYGAGRKAKVESDVNITIGCIPYPVGNVYGGSEQADIDGNVTLTILGGTFDNVFGGNNAGGKIDGTITVNIEERSDGCYPIIIGNLYGGGNEAPYPGSGANISTPSITVNAKSFTSIGNIYGGGKGSSAKVTGKTIVNVDEVKGYWADKDYTPINSTTATHIPNAIGTIGNVYGGGDAADVIGETEVNIGTKDKVKINGVDTDVLGVNITENVYGGGNAADVDGKTTINIGTQDFTGTGKEGTKIGGSVFGGGFGASTTVTGDVNVNIGGMEEGTGGAADTYFGYAEITGDVYGGSAKGKVNATKSGDAPNYTYTASTGTTKVKLYGGTVDEIYGGGYGLESAKADVYGAVTVDVYGGTATSVYGANNLSGAPQGTVIVNIISTATPTSPATYAITNVFGGGNQAAYAGTPSVSLTGNSYVGNVFGGGNAAKVAASNVTINTNATSSYIGNVFGGGNEEGTTGNSLVTMDGGIVNTAIYGGCNTSGTIAGTAIVTVNGGTIGNSASTAYQNDDVLFGGGLGKGTSVTGKVTLELASMTDNAAAKIYGNVYGGSKQGGVTDVDVKLLGATIYGNVFGGGYDTYKDDNTTVTAANDVTVTLNGSTLVPTYDNGVEADGKQSGVTGQIFGGNNKNGSPVGDVTVLVKKTVGSTKDDAVTRDNRTTYDVAAVYGGGNMANYTASGKSAKVIIEGCDATAIKYVYGGGNAASVPATDVTVKGTYIIDVLYGGGNGISTPANVNGATNVKLIGGKIHKVYGGSNSQGNVSGGTNVTMPKKPEGAAAPDYCTTLDVREIYGAGNNADQDGGTTVVLGCVEGLDVVYGGAKNANVAGGVNLAVTSGTFKKVFGGNDTAGTIQGPINLYIEETGCDPLIIGELYLGGNLAPYSVYGYKKVGDKLEPRISMNDGEAVNVPTTHPEGQLYADPVLHVTSFTSIGKIFGGGLGQVVGGVDQQKAWLYGNPTVKINEIVGENSSTAFESTDMSLDEGTSNAHTVTLPARDADAIGAIGDVYGGGSLAKVIGNTTVEICKDAEVYMHSLPKDTENQYPKKTVVGANIIGNVFGGGLGATATVEGNTEIQVGGILDNDKITIAKSVYGGGELAQVAGNTNIVINSGTIGDKAVKKGGATIGNVYGGGFGSLDDKTAGLIK